MRGSRSQPRGTRLGAFLVAAAVVGIPAGALRALCVGKACDRRATARAGAGTPFCSLPARVRDLVASGFYEGRSPDVLAVTAEPAIAGGDAFGRGEPAPLWPSAAGAGAGRVPIAFTGAGVAPGATVPAGTGLADVADTIAAVVGLRRPHASVRSGEAVPAVAAGPPPALVLEVVWKGVGTSDLERAPRRWPNLARLMRAGPSTLDGRVGSEPLDPAAALATIGTGGLPSEHGITGTIMRPAGAVVAAGADGEPRGVVEAFGRGAPETVIATLGDHLDEIGNNEPVVGVVGTHPSDRGLIGGSWYPGRDRDPAVILAAAARPGRQAAAAVSLLRREGFGADSVTDLAAVAMTGPVAGLDRALPKLVRAAQAVSGGSAAVVVTATGAQTRPGRDEVAGAAGLRRRLGGMARLIEAVAPGGVYLDERALARRGASDGTVARALARLRTDEGEPVMADVFPAIAVTFGRYC